LKLNVVSVCSLDAHISSTTTATSVRYKVGYSGGIVFLTISS